MFHGSMVALVTPMQADGQVDYDSFVQLLDWHYQNGTSAIVVLGTTGESATLNVEERRQLIKLACKELKGKLAVIAGTGANATTVAIEYTKMAMEDGADACLLVTPYYNKPTQEGLYQHYKAVADAVPIPQILYNVPGRTGCDLQPATAIRLAPITNIIGIKEATGEIDRVTQIKEAVQEGMDIYSGDDPTALALIKAGGKGVISVTANVVPKLFSEMCQAALAEDYATAEKINQQLVALNKALFVESNPIPTKWALNQMKKIPSGIRLPLTPLAEQAQAVVKEALTDLKLL